MQTNKSLCVIPTLVGATYQHQIVNMDISTIESLRKNRGLTQRELADSIGVTVQGYQKMIDTNDVKVSTLIKICKSLNLDITTFFGSKNIVAEPLELYSKKGKKLTYKLSEVETVNVDNKEGVLTVVLKK